MTNDRYGRGMHMLTQCDVCDDLDYPVPAGVTLRHTCVVSGQGLRLFDCMYVPHLAVAMTA